MKICDYQIVSIPPDQAFNHLADFESTRSYERDVETEIASHGQGNVGTEYRQRRKFLRFYMKGSLRITAYEKHAKVSWIARFKWVKVTGSYRFDPVCDGTKISYKGEYKIEGPLKILTPLFRYAEVHRVREFLTEFKYTREQATFMKERLTPFDRFQARLGVRSCLDCGYLVRPGRARAAPHHEENLSNARNSLKANRSVRGNEPPREEVTHSHCFRNLWVNRNDYLTLGQRYR